ncbi:hypothetical protein DXG01_006402 [Tephrocybe rancida]|nr:hypothetical protein DXG01_006402 [Tephrocybe rancida]
MPYGHADNLVISPTRDPSSPQNIMGVTLSGPTTNVTFDQQCVQTLVFSEQIMHNSKREDLTFVLLQFWLFAISLIAIMYDSVPHTFHLLPQATNLAKQIPNLLLSVTALLIACYLSLTLLRDYNAQSFKCVGAPEHINRINKFFMALLACLQLECFVLVAAAGLWADVLVNTAIAEISAHTPVYKALFTATTILLIPWIAMGWFAIRREMKVMMVAFLGIALFLLSGWSIMFYSRVYRWTFMQWPYLGCFTVASLVLIIASIVLGVICRLNFGKGLAQYRTSPSATGLPLETLLTLKTAVHAEAALASTNFAPEVFKHDEEKEIMDLDFKVPATFEGTDEAFYTAPAVPKRTSSLQKLPPAYVSGSPPTSTYNVPYNVPF